MLAPARAHSRLKPEKRDVAAFMVSARAARRGTNVYIFI